VRVVRVDHVHEVEPGAGRGGESPRLPGGFLRALGPVDPDEDAREGLHPFRHRPPTLGTSTFQGVGVSLATVSSAA